MKVSFNILKKCHCCSVIFDASTIPLEKSLTGLLGHCNILQPFRVIGGYDTNPSYIIELNVNNSVFICSTIAQDTSYSASKHTAADSAVGSTVDQSAILRGFLMFAREYGAIFTLLAFGMGGELELLFDLFVEIVFCFLLPANTIFRTMMHV